jgi:hypothetical protein
MNAADRATMRLSLRALHAMAREAGVAEVGTGIETRRRIVNAFQEGHCDVIDGHPGDNTLGALWSISKPSRETFLARAQYAADASDKTIYKLGRGGFGWFEDELDPAADCSGFVAHCLDRSRTPQSDFAWGNTEWWWSTDSMYADAVKHHRVLRQVSAPSAGTICVYPDSNGKQGHTGIVAEVRDGKLIGYDCSSSQYRKIGDAIWLRDLSFFLRKPSAIFCEPIHWSDPCET